MAYVKEPNKFHNWENHLKFGTNRTKYRKTKELEAIWHT